jgi:hypothetical protein
MSLRTGGRPREGSHCHLGGRHGARGGLGARGPPASRRGAQDASVFFSLARMPLSIYVPPPPPLTFVVVAARGRDASHGQQAHHGKRGELHGCERWCVCRPVFFFCGGLGGRARVSCGERDASPSSRPPPTCAVARARPRRLHGRLAQGWHKPCGGVEGRGGRRGGARARLASGPLGRARAAAGGESNAARCTPCRGRATHQRGRRRAGPPPHGWVMADLAVLCVWVVGGREGGIGRGCGAGARLFLMGRRTCFGRNEERVG